MKKLVIGGDHRGYVLKENLKSFLTSKGYEVVDVGTNSTEPCDYPDIAALIAKKMISGEAERGIMVCGSGVGASVAANKFKGIRAAVCHDTFSAHQGVEDDDMNFLCLGGGIIGESVAKEIVIAFVEAKFKPEERYIRRLEKVKKIEEGNRN
jgi:ribose 5-phosphate isomerase B